MERMRLKRLVVFGVLVLSVAVGGVQEAEPSRLGDAARGPLCASVPCPPPKYN